MNLKSKTNKSSKTTALSFPSEDSLSNIAEEHKNFRYTELPTRYRRAYIETRTDNNYLSLRDDIAFTVAVLQDLVKNLDEFDVTTKIYEKIRKLATRAERINAYKEPNKANNVLAELTRINMDASSPGESLKEIRLVQRHLIALIEAERKRLEAGQNAMLMEDVFSILRKSIQAVKKAANTHIYDPRERRQFLEEVSQEFDKELSLVGLANYSPTEAIKPTRELKYSDTPLDPRDLRPEDVTPTILEEAENDINSSLDNIYRQAPLQSFPSENSPEIELGKGMIPFSSNDEDP